MLTTLGRGLSPLAANAFARRFYLTSALPKEITFSRASVATYLNSAGKLTSAATNTPRFDHTKDGRKLGLLLEGAITNKNTNYNANPTATTGFTTSGDANGVLSIVSDNSALAAAGLDLLCTSGNVYCANNSAGSTAFVVSFPATVANTNKHSASVYLRSPQTGTVGSVTLNASPQSIAGTAAYTRVTLDNQTPDSSSRRTTLSVAAGKTVYFILNQLEENFYSSSVIVTTGASASRSTDRAYIDNIQNYPWYSATQGYIAVRYFLPALNTADSYIAVLHDGTTNNTIGLRLQNVDHDLVAYLRGASTNLFTTSNDDLHVAGTMHGCGIAWKSGEGLILSGAKPKVGALGSLPTGMTRLDIGMRNGGTSPMQGHIQMIEVGRDIVDAYALASKYTEASDIALACGGQSLMVGHFQSQEDGSDIGKQTHRAAIGAALPDRIVTMVNGATGSSAVCKTSNGSAYWWDEDTDTPGPCLNDFFTAITDNGLKPTAILWAQGEADCHYIGGVTPLATYQTSLLKIFTAMRERLGNLPVFIQRLGRRTVFSNPGGIQAIRDTQHTFIDIYDWCHDAGEIYDLPLYDNVHLGNAGYVAAAKRNAACIVPVFDNTVATARAPRITNAQRTGTSVTVTLVHNGGTDITPTSAIEGFVFTDNGSPITITAAVRTNATTVTLTLDSPPASGNEALYYGFDDLSGINTAQILRDNGPLATSLGTTKTIL